MFPVLFIFHDMEEVIWLPGFIGKNREDIIKQYPIAEKLLSVYKMDMTVDQKEIQSENGASFCTAKGYVIKCQYCGEVTGRQNT